MKKFVTVSVVVALDYGQDDVNEACRSEFVAEDGTITLPGSAVGYWEAALGVGVDPGGSPQEMGWDHLTSL